MEGVQMDMLNASNPGERRDFFAGLEETSREVAGGIIHGELRASGEKSVAGDGGGVRSVARIEQELGTTQVSDQTTAGEDGDSGGDSMMANDGDCQVSRNGGIEDDFGGVADLNDEDRAGDKLCGGEDRTCNYGEDGVRNGDDCTRLGQDLVGNSHVKDGVEETSSIPCEGYMANNGREIGTLSRIAIVYADAELSGAQDHIFSTQPMLSSQMFMMGCHGRSSSLPVFTGRLHTGNGGLSISGGGSNGNSHGNTSSSSSLPCSIISSARDRENGESFEIRGNNECALHITTITDNQRVTTESENMFSKSPKSNHCSAEINVCGIDPLQSQDVQCGGAKGGLVRDIGAPIDDSEACVLSEVDCSRVAETTQDTSSTRHGEISMDLVRETVHDKPSDSLLLPVPSSSSGEPQSETLCNWLADFNDVVVKGSGEEDYSDFDGDKSSCSGDGNEEPLWSDDDDVGDKRKGKNGDCLFGMEAIGHDVGMRGRLVKDLRRQDEFMLTLLHTQFAQNAPPASERPCNEVETGDSCDCSGACNCSLWNAPLATQLDDFLSDKMLPALVVTDRSVIAQTAGATTNAEVNFRNLSICDKLVSSVRKSSTSMWKSTCDLPPIPEDLPAPPSSFTSSLTSRSIPKRSGNTRDLNHSMKCLPPIPEDLPKPPPSFTSGLHSRSLSKRSGNTRDLSHSVKGLPPIPEDLPEPPTSFISVICSPPIREECNDREPNSSPARGMCADSDTSLRLIPDPSLSTALENIPRPTKKRSFMAPLHKLKSVLISSASKIKNFFNTPTLKITRNHSTDSTVDPNGTIPLSLIPYRCYDAPGLDDFVHIVSSSVLATRLSVQGDSHESETSCSSWSNSNISSVNHVDSSAAAKTKSNSAISVNSKPRPDSNSATHQVGFVAMSQTDFLNAPHIVKDSPNDLNNTDYSDSANRPASMSLLSYRLFLAENHKIATKENSTSSDGFQAQTPSPKVANHKRSQTVRLLSDTSVQSSAVSSPKRVSNPPASTDRPCAATPSVRISNPPGFRHHRARLERRLFLDPRVDHESPAKSQSFVSSLTNGDDEFKDAVDVFDNGVGQEEEKLGGEERMNRENALENAGKDNAVCADNRDSGKINLEASGDAVNGRQGVDIKTHQIESEDNSCGAEHNNDKKTNYDLETINKETMDLINRAWEARNRQQPNTISVNGGDSEPASIDIKNGLIGDLSNGRDEEASDETQIFSYIPESEIIPSGVSDPMYRHMFRLAWEKKNPALPKNCMRRIHIVHCCGSPNFCAGQVRNGPVPKNCQFTQDVPASETREDLFQDAVKEGRIRRALQSCYFDANGRRWGNSENTLSFRGAPTMRT